MNSNIENGVVVAEDVAVTVNMNDNAINNSIINNGDLTISGGEVKVGAYGIENRGNLNVEDMAVNAGSNADYALINLEF